MTEFEAPITTPAPAPEPVTAEMGSPLEVSSDRHAEERSKNYYDYAREALVAGDRLLATGYLDIQREEAALSQMRVEGAGLDPGTTVAPNAAWTDPNIEQQRQQILVLQRNARIRQVFEEHDVESLKGYFQDVMTDYKTRNGEFAERLTDHMSPDQLVSYYGQLQPVVRDPNEVAEVRQRLVKMNLALKEIHPKLNVWNHPETAKLAHWLSREATASSLGYLQSGEQQLEMGFAGERAMDVMALAEGVTDFGLNLLYGAYEYSGRAVESMTGGRVGWVAPTNYIMGDDGKIYSNAGKVPGIVETMAGTWAAATNQNVNEFIARVNGAKHNEAMQASGFNKITRGISGVVGMGFGFGLPAGAAMRGGQVAFQRLTMNGLRWLSVGGATRAGMTLSPRATKITKIMAGTAGAGVANGMMEGIAFGRHEGFGKAFVHGFAMAPVLMAFGAIGRGTEKAMFFRRVKVDGVTKWVPRKNMPEKFAHMVAGGVEGIGFGTMEAHQTGALWNFVNEPSLETWQIYLKNMVGFALFKGMTGRSPFEVPGEAVMRQAMRRETQAKFGEEVLEARETGQPEGGREAEAKLETGPPGEPMEIKGVQPSAEKLMEQAGRGELVEPETISKREVLEERTKKAEAQGRDPLEEPDFQARPEGERRAIMAGGTAKERRQISEEFEGPERRQEIRRDPPRSAAIARDLARLRAEGPTPENRKRIQELLEEKRGTVAEAGAEFAQKLGAEVSRGERRPGKAPVTEQRQPRGNLEERIAEAERLGITEELLMELGQASRARRQALTPEAAETAYRRQQEIEKEIDAIEARMEPVTAARMRELEEQGILEPQDLPAIKPRPGPSGGRARGGSMGPAANPYRQRERVPGGKPIRASDIHASFEGRQGVAGVRIPFTSIRLGKVLGTAVQVAMRAGRIAKRTTLGVFKLFENMTRTKAGLDLVVHAHEWSHAMMRQALFGKGGGGQSFVKQAREWLQNLPPEAQNDIMRVLEFYPGALQGKLRIWQLGAEGWAEWFARDLLGDETLYAEVPALSKWMLKWLGAPEQANLAGSPQSQYRVLQEQLSRYRLQGSRERVAQTIRRGEGEKRGSWYERQSENLRTLVDNVARAFYDDMVSLKRSQAKWLKISDVDPTEIDILDNPARLFDTIRMVSAKQAENFLLRGTHTLSFKRKGEPLADILSTEGVKNRKTEFVDYVVAVRAADLLRKGKTQPLPLEDYVQAIKELENPLFIEAAKRLKIWSDALLDLVGEAGNLPGSDIQRMKDYSLVYIPFVRQLEGPRPSFGGRGVAEKGAGIKRTKGATEEIMDPVKALEDVTRSMITKAHQQMVMRALYKMTLKAEVGGLATVVDRKNVPAQYRLDQVFRTMRKKIMEELPELEGMEVGEQGELTAEKIMEWAETFGMLGEMLQETGISDQLLTLFGQKALPYSEADAIVAYTPRLTAAEIEALPADRRGVAQRQNGKMLWMQLDVPAYEALMGIDMPTGPTFLDLPIIKQIIGYPVRWTRFFATDANPAFVAANMLRDAMSAPVFDPEGKFRPFAGFYKLFMGGAELLKGGEFAQMFEASGAGVSSFFNEGVRREMRGEASTFIEKAAQGVMKATDTWKRWMSKPESFIRIYEFRKIYEDAQREGKSDTEAAFLALEAAREITVNFARGGVLSRALNQMIPYFNASFQGQRKMLRSLAGAEGQTDVDRARIQRAAFANGLVNITVPALVIWAMVKDEDWYKDLPEWRKRFYFNMKFSDDGPIISLPKPFELGLLFGTLPEIWADRAAGSNPIAVAPTLYEMVMPYLRGLGSMIPVFARPLIEQETGYDFFSQRALTPYWTSRTLPPEEQVRASTSETAKWIFKEFPSLVGLTGAENPIELEHLLGGYTAGAGVTGLRMVDEMLDLRNHPGVAPGIAAPLSSFYNRFFRQTPHGSSRTVQDLYDLGDQLQAQSGGQMSAIDRGTLSRINAAKIQIGSMRKAANAGRISREESDLRAFQIANEIMRTVR